MSFPDLRDKRWTHGIFYMMKFYKYSNAATYANPGRGFQFQMLDTNRGTLTSGSEESGI